MEITIQAQSCIKPSLSSTCGCSWCWCKRYRHEVSCCLDGFFLDTVKCWGLPRSRVTPQALGCLGRTAFKKLE